MDIKGTSDILLMLRCDIFIMLEWRATRGRALYVEAGTGYIRLGSIILSS